MKRKEEVENTVSQLESLGDPSCVDGMARYGIRSKGVLGVPMPAITRIAKSIGSDHELADELWRTDIYDARILAALIDDSDMVTEEQMDRWVKDFDSWAICDGLCVHLFNDTPFAFDKAFAWTKRNEEFVRRAGFALMASLAVHDKKAGDAVFIRFLPLIQRFSNDERVYVKKAVNWALRQIGKRNIRLNKRALEMARKLRNSDSKSAKWIASDALRELESEPVQKRLKSKKS